jgi:glucose 1-dehydrogenase
MRLAGKSAIVTGASRGIGKAIALAFGREGASIVVDYFGRAEGADTVVEEIVRGGGRAIAVRADVTKPDEVRALVERTQEAFGGVDVIVNNAGFEEKHPFLETPFDAYEKVLAVNLTGVWLCSQAAAGAMIVRGKGGRIINISSVHENIAMPGNAPYCAAKGAVRMLARTIALELAPHGITVNDVCPGAVDTPMDETVKQDPSELRELLDWIPLKRMAKPQEVAELCVYLASDAASYVTGSSYAIDGGMERCAGSL